MISNPGRYAARMAMSPAEATSVSRGEPRSRTDLALEMIALRHQIAVLKRSGSRRPCSGLWDRLFWILLSWWWPVASQNLIRRGPRPPSFMIFDKVVRSCPAPAVP